MGGSTMTSINQLFDNFEKAQRDLRLGLQKALKASGAMANGETLDSLGVELKTVDVYYGLRTRKEASSSCAGNLGIHAGEVERIRRKPDSLLSRFSFQLLSI